MDLEEYLVCCTSVNIIQISFGRHPPHLLVLSHIIFGHFPARHQNLGSWKSTGHLKKKTSHSFFFAKQRPLLLQDNLLRQCYVIFITFTICTASVWCLNRPWMQESHICTSVTLKGNLFVLKPFFFIIIMIIKLYLLCFQTFTVLQLFIFIFNINKKLNFTQNFRFQGITHWFQFSNPILSWNFLVMFKVDMVLWNFHLCFLSTVV